mgnify:CR=1 FL=1|jgi:hypothetical protein
MKDLAESLRNVAAFFTNRVLLGNRQRIPRVTTLTGVLVVALLVDRAIILKEKSLVKRRKLEL